MIFSFDTEKREWQSRKPLPVNLNIHAAVELNGLIYVGGVVCLYTYSLYCYNHDNDSWSEKPCNVDLLYNLSFSKTNQFLYAIDGDWIVHQYDTSQDKWTTVIKYQ